MKKSLTLLAAALCGCFLNVQGADALTAKYAKVFRPESEASLQKLKEAGLMNLGYALPKAKPGYPATCEVVTADGRPVLRLISHGDAKTAPGSQFAKFRVIEESGNFKKVCLGMEFKLNEKNDKPQLQMSAVIGKTKDFPGYLAFVQFGNNKVELLMQNPKKPKASSVNVTSFDIGTEKYHAFTLEADASTGMVYISKEGDRKAVASGKMPLAIGKPVIAFGDGSGAIFGSADITYFAWKLE